MRCCVPYFCYVCVAEASFDRLPLDLASSTHAPHDMMRPVNTTAQPKCRSGICKAGSAPFRRSLGMGGGLWSSVVGCNCNPVIEICPLSGALRRGTTRYGTYFYFLRIASHRIASHRSRHRGPVVPEYLPTKPKASLIALAAVGITLGPGTQLGEPRPNSTHVYGALSFQGSQGSQGFRDPR